MAAFLFAAEYTKPSVVPDVRPNSPPRLGPCLWPPPCRHTPHASAAHASAEEEKLLWRDAAHAPRRAVRGRGGGRTAPPASGAPAPRAPSRRHLRALGGVAGGRLGEGRHLARALRFAWLGLAWLRCGRLGRAPCSHSLAQMRSWPRPLSK
eukprot:scaffold5941_cov269-Prasinococcus_capsulatus_cf.AAC.2